MTGWEIETRATCAALTGAAAVVFALGPRPRAARFLWSALLAAGLLHAVVLTSRPANLVNINLVHHYLGAKYAVPYAEFYALVNAARERPQVAMRDLEHPPGMIRQDPRERRAYYLDLLRAEAVSVDPLVPLEALRRQAEASGAVRREAERILNRHLPADRVEPFREDVQRALSATGWNRDITTDYGWNGSPFYALVRQVDPTLHRPFGPATAWMNLFGQIAAMLLSAWLIGAALDLDVTGRIAVAALLLASWDLVGYALPGLILGELWLPVAVALVAVRRGHALLAGGAVAWAGLLKLFPLVLLLPLAARWGSRFGRRAVLAAGVSLAGFGLLAAAGGRSWAEFLHKIAAQFHLEGYLLNSVSLSQALLALGVRGFAWSRFLSLLTLGLLVVLCLRGRSRDPALHLPQLGLVLLAALAGVAHTWFNYYALAPLFLLPWVATRHPRGAALCTLGMAGSALLPEFDDPLLLSAPALHLLKLLPYVAVPGWFVILELRSLTFGRWAVRALLVGIAVIAAGTAAEVWRGRTIARLDREGSAFLDRGDARGALACYATLVRLDPRNAMGHMNAGIAEVEGGARETAGTRFARAVALDPENPTARQNYGRWLLGAGRWDAAAVQIEAARAHAPCDDTLLHDLATIRFREGRAGEARALLERARELAPENQAVRHELEEMGQTPQP